MDWSGNARAVGHFCRKGTSLFLFTTFLFSCATVDYRLNEAITRGDMQTARRLLEESTVPILHNSMNLAVQSGRKDMVELLIAYHADINGGTEGLKPLQLAIERGDLSMVKLLADNYANFDLPDAEGNPIWHTAIKSGRKDIVEVFLSQVRNIDHKDSEGKTPLWVAVKNNDQEMAVWLISKKADAELPDNDLVTPLHLAAAAGNRDMAETLINHGAHVNTPNTKGWTPLHYAAQAGDSEIATMLLNAGADVNAKSITGWRPLDRAEFNNHKALVQLLKQRGGRQNPALRVLHKGMSVGQVEEIVGSLGFTRQLMLGCALGDGSVSLNMNVVDKAGNSMGLAFDCEGLVSWTPGPAEVGLKYEARQD